MKQARRHGNAEMNDEPVARLGEKVSPHAEEARRAVSKHESGLLITAPESLRRRAVIGKDITDEI